MSRICYGCMEAYDDALNMCPHCGYVDGERAEQEIHMDPGTYLYDRYIVGNVIGYGGFGVTYVGWDARLEQKVAIKEYLPSEYATRMAGQSRVTVFGGNKTEHYHKGMRKFVDEAKNLAKCTNTDGIVKIFDAFEENDTAYIIMEYLEGETLAECLKREKNIPEDEAVRMLLPIMNSLEIVHKQGIIHRDIAPDNIFITKDGNVKLIDFGASRFSSTSQSRSLTVIIKPGYSPEEQYRSRGDQGPHTDVYAIAATLYKMITGKTPPDALERRAFFENKKKDILEPLVKYDKNISRNRENAILNAVNIRIEDRTPDMETFIEQLTTTQPVKRINHKISKIDVLRWPLWAKIGIPTAVVTVVTLIVLLANGIIGYKSNLNEAIEIPEGMVRVPSVVNIAQSEAEKVLEKSNLSLYISNSLPSADIPMYYVLSQETVEGLLISEYQQINVTLSEGIKTHLMPSVIGLSQEAAISLLETNEFGYEIKEVYNKGIAEGHVVSQSVAGNENYEVGGIVVLEISLGPSPEDLTEVKKVKVPNFVGMTYEEVQESAINLGLTISIIEDRYSEAPINEILEQNILPDTEIDNIQVVGLVKSAGIEKFSVPFLVTKTEQEAREIINGKLNIVIIEEERDGYEKGAIIAQSLEAKTIVEVGGTITLTICAGSESFCVKDVVGKTESQGKNVLSTQQLSVSVTYKKDSSVPEGCIISQSPSANSNVKRGDKVTIVVSSGKPLYEIPDLCNKEKSIAAKMLQDIKIKAEYTEAYSNDIEKGYVISQSVTAGNKLTEGSKVVITISKGKQPITVNFVATNGQCTTTSKTVTYGDAYGTLPNATRTGYILKGWFTGQTGGIQIKDTSISKITSTQTLYAQWTPIKYTVVYNGNGATSGSMSNSTYAYDTSNALASNTFKKTGYTFRGWSLSSGSNTVKYTNGQSIKNLKAKQGEVINLYAVWSADAPSGWTTDASFVNNPYYTYKTKTQYCVENRTVNYVTLHPTNEEDKTWLINHYAQNGGYTEYKQAEKVYSEWTSWSDWSKDAKSSSDLCQVESKQVKDYVKRNKYFAWTIRSSGVSAWFDNGGEYHYLIDYNNEMKYCKKVTVNGQTVDSYYFPEKYFNQKEIWYYEGQVDVESGSHTEYRYRTRTLQYTIYLRAYGGWTFNTWSDTKPTETDTCRVNGTRTVYYYTAK
ncbi:MAG: PASTA domain-containing protein [Lachnospiraceae bacterium]|nr:PASTA domain-containing protein [Lachnospiraceae bacterium]